VRPNPAFATDAVQHATRLLEKHDSGHSMVTYRVTVSWERGPQAFLDDRYSRAHVWRFDGGVELRASSSPEVVPLPLSDPSAVDPEEAFVAAISSCHMLWFLSIAAKRRFLVDSYADDAEGLMAANAEGRMAITRVTLRPKVAFSGAAVPSRRELDDMHHVAHASCFIANSVRSEVVCDPDV
jgi:organic hydroperoxide reductase OsmC/OhrA